MDPALEQDIYGDKPWALSPMIASKCLNADSWRGLLQLTGHLLANFFPAMNYIQVTQAQGTAAEQKAWSPNQPEEDTSVLARDKDDATLSNLKGNPDGRRAHFAKEDNRKAITMTPEHWFNMDFCNGERVCTRAVRIATLTARHRRLHGLQHAVTEASGWSFFLSDAILGWSSEKFRHLLLQTSLTMGTILAACHICLQIARRVERLLLHSLCRP